MSTEGQGRTSVFLLGLLAGIIVAALVGTGAFWLLNRSASKPIMITPPALNPQPTATLTPPESTPAPLFVHVDGAVQATGVYIFPAGGIVQDAIEAAGGFAPDAVTRQVNLAQPLIGGMHIYVPDTSEDVANEGADGAPPVITIPEATLDPTLGRGGAPTSGLTNINTAELAELEELPGIGPALAQRIIDHRIEYGPFGAIEDILDVSGIGEAKFEAIKELIGVSNAP